MVLPMIVYTSGYFHVGHVRSYVPCLALHQWREVVGATSACPFGYDSHGLPTEVKAEQEGVDPDEWTETCIANMEATLVRMGMHFTGERMRTSSTSYIKWQQRMFVDLFNAGLIYRQPAWVFYDPKLMTTLANEQVVGGVSERSGAAVEERLLTQWFFHTRRFAGELVDGLDGLD